MTEKRTPEPWAIVLAAGEGSRLASVTHNLYSDARPKQFAVLRGEKSLLQTTMDRIAPLIPAHRTLVVVSPAFADLAREQLTAYEGVQIVEQPGNRGTAAGVLLPLTRLLAREPNAPVVIFPSDHEFAHPERFRQGVTTALAALPVIPAGVALVGVRAEEPAIDLGWILPGGPLKGRLDIQEVAQFIEKPDLAQATQLFGAGALWNTMVTVGSAKALWRMAVRHVRTQAEFFARYFVAVGGPLEQFVLRNIYREMPSADFSRDILGKSHGLGVVAVDHCGWSDWGTPERLYRSLAELGELDALETRLRVGQEQSLPLAA